MSRINRFRYINGMRVFAHVQNIRETLLFFFFFFLIMYNNIKKKKREYKEGDLPYRLTRLHVEDCYY